MRDLLVLAPVPTALVAAFVFLACADPLDLPVYGPALADGEGVRLDPRKPSSVGD